MGRLTDSEQKRQNLVGSNVGYYRQQQNLTQQELADKLETIWIYICRGSISRIESGERTVTDIELYGLSKILNVSIDDLFKNT